ncbi:MAG: Flp/Fap pilin component [Caulobacteraceae bacterium]|nr:Flp/Fap pilin component [Caulobacteraceae bacterium]
MSSFVKRFVADQTGATAIEYGMIAALMTIAIVAGITAVGSKLTALFTKVTNDYPTS